VPVPSQELDFQQHELKIIEKSVIQKAVDGMKSEGRTYKGKKHRYFVLAADCITVNPVYEGRGCHGCDRMVVGFTTTCAISAYHH
jgi:hypothetical protein